MELATHLLKDVLSDYQRHMALERGLSRKTRFGNASWVRRYIRWLEANGYPDPTTDEFNLPVLRRYIQHLAEKGLRPRTLHGSAYPLRGIGYYMVDEGLLTDNPAAKLQLPKRDAARRTVTSDSEVQRLLDACERQPNPAEVAMTRAIVSIFSFLGIRRQELLDLKAADIDLETNSLLVVSGKGAKSRRLPLNREAQVALREWLALRPDHPNNPWLWPLDTRRRVGHGWLKDMFERLRAISGLHDHVKPHSIRHSAASRMHRAGASLRDVQVFLGHSSVVTTAGYLHASEESLRHAAELASLRPATAQAEAPTMRRNTDHRRRALMRL